MFLDLFANNVVEVVSVLWKALANEGVFDAFDAPDILTVLHFEPHYSQVFFIGQMEAVVNILEGCSTSLVVLLNPNGLQILQFHFTQSHIFVVDVQLVFLILLAKLCELRIIVIRKVNITKVPQIREPFLLLVGRGKHLVGHRNLVDALLDLVQIIVIVLDPVLYRLIVSDIVP